MAEQADKSNRGQAPEKPKPAGYFEGESMTRRTVFALGGQALGGAAVAAVALPVVGFALAPIFDRPEETWEGVGSPDDFIADTYRQAVITIVDGVGDSGKTTVYIRQRERRPRRGPEQLHRDLDPLRPPRLPGPLRPGRRQLHLPCHGGVYDFEGQVIGGPPVRPLDRFQTRVSGDTLEVGPRYSVTNDLEPVRARDPGEYTGGIWEYLYPPRFTTPPAP